MEEYIWEGFDAYISKPVKPDKLESMIAEMLPQELVLTSHDLVPSLCTPENADSVNTDSYDDEERVSLPEISGIDNETALKNLMSANLVLTTMNVFMNGADGEADSLRKCFDVVNNPSASDEELEKALADYRIKVHAMKSSALTIGAVMVSNLAKFLEYSARDKNTENIKSVTLPFLNEWKALSDRMKEVLQVNKPTAAADSTSLDRDRSSGLLDELNTKLCDMDIDSADEIMKQLEAEGVAAVFSEEYGMLQQAVINIDLDLVSSLVEQIKEKMDR